MPERHEQRRSRFDPGARVFGRHATVGGYVHELDGMGRLEQHAAELASRPSHVRRFGRAALAQQRPALERPVVHHQRRHRFGVRELQRTRQSFLEHLGP